MIGNFDRRAREQYTYTDKSRTGDKASDTKTHSSTRAFGARVEVTRQRKGILRLSASSTATFRLTGEHCGGQIVDRETGR